ncbi:hypothetical protein SB748_29220 [Rhizobium sp. SIMBA_035]
MLSEILADADLVAVDDQRWAPQGKNDAEGEFYPFLITFQHWGDTAANAAIENLHLFLRSEGPEHGLFQIRRHSREIELIKVTKEIHPTAAWRRFRKQAQSLIDRRSILLGKPGEEVAGQHEIKQKLELVALSEESVCRLGWKVNFAEQNAARSSALHIAADLSQDSMRIARVGVLETFVGDDEWSGI